MRWRAQSAQSLFEFSRKLSAAADLDDILSAAAANAQRIVELKGIAMLTPVQGELRLAAAWPPVAELTVAEMGAARWAYEKVEAAGASTGTLPNVRFQFRPLATSRGVVAVCGVEPKGAGKSLSAQDERMLATLLDQTAIAIDRSLLVGEAVKAATLEESERVRTLLLSSLSHDLRTPLTSIMGAVTGLRQFGEKLSARDREDLLQSIEEEAGRLNRFVGNLLEMSRIEAGAIAPRQRRGEKSRGAQRENFLWSETLPQSGARLAAYPGGGQLVGPGHIQSPGQCP
jgi:two-component system sensor histidine kinase KdpD